MSQLFLVALIGFYGSYCSSGPSSDSNFEVSSSPDPEPNSEVSSNPDPDCSSNSEASSNLVSDDGFFLVDSWEDLACVGSAGATNNCVDCSNKTNWTLSASYLLSADIDISSKVLGIGGRRDGNDGDCASYDGDSGNASPGDLGHGETCAGWEPIGDDASRFTGTFDGDGFKITNLYINRPNTDDVGLFGVITSNTAEIRNVGVEVDIVLGQNSVGGLVGSMDNESSLSNNYATGAVSGSEYIGGLVGWMDESSLSNNYATGAVSGSEYIGGLVGWMDESSLSNNYATGAVSGSKYIGGLVGWMDNESSLSNSYAMGNVTENTAGVASDAVFAGGLVGYMYDSSLSNSYATGNARGRNNNNAATGGLVGDLGYMGTITGINYFVDASVESDGVGDGSCATSTCMQQTLNWLRDTLDESTTLSWDGDIWGDLGASGSFPCLKGVTPMCN